MGALIKRIRLAFTLTAKGWAEFKIRRFFSTIAGSRIDPMRVADGSRRGYSHRIIIDRIDRPRKFYLKIRATRRDRGHDPDANKDAGWVTDNIEILDMGTPIAYRREDWAY